MEEYIMDKGGKTTGAETLMDYTNAICSIPDLGNVRNGYETFSGNTVLEEIPECLADASQYFTSMYKFCKDCTALKRVLRLYTENVTTFVYASSPSSTPLPTSPERESPRRSPSEHETRPN